MNHPTNRGVSVTTPFCFKPTLRGELVTLRPIRSEDVEVIDALIREDKEVARLTGASNSSTAPLARMPIEQLRGLYGRWAEADDRLVLAVIDNASERVVGEMVLNEWDEANRSCNFRGLVGKPGQGRGLGTEATRLMVQHGLTTMGLHRITLEVFDFNPRARHVYAKVGFADEGTGRDALLFDGEWIDVHYMAILGPWPQGASVDTTVIP